MNTVYRLSLLVTIFPVLQSSGRQQYNTCVSPQYLELGGTGTISCTFQDELFSLLWYNTTEYSQNEPILQYQNSMKTGIGYTSGKYDIHSNGSLLINEVSLQHNCTFTVAYILTEEDVPTFINVRVIVTHVTLARCQSPQFGQVGDHHILRCVITINFENISWYKEGLDDAIVTYRKQTARDTSDAPKYDNDEYGLLIDGSLIIYDAGLKRSNVKYTVKLIDNGTFGKISQTVEFIALNGTPTKTPAAGKRMKYENSTTSESFVSEEHSQNVAYQPEGRFDLPIFVINLAILLLAASFFILWRTKSKFTQQEPFSINKIPQEVE